MEGDSDSSREESLDIVAIDEDMDKIMAKPETFDILETVDDVVPDDSHFYGEEDYRSK